ncbi:MAG TPA: hypothetical protein QGI39_01435 [Gammaproteobacteria bacterium]|nr:hypothetical protein [Gammaproteobacteria bacterium]
MSDKDIDKPEPVDFDVAGNPLFSDQPAQAKSDRPSIWVWLGLGSLLIVALAVIFVLPTIVTEYELPLERRLAVTELQPSLPAVSRNQPSEISPFDEAQRSLERKQAQDVLADLLLKQAELDQLEVQRWGLADYENSLEQARGGDELYREQGFGQARDAYQRGRDGLQALIDSIPVVMTQTLIEAQVALDAADTEAAMEQYSLALLFDPDNELAQIGYQRAQSLEEVTSLLTDAGERYEDGELQVALESYQNALDLDSYNEVARAQIQQVAAEIRENEFSQIMSAGYSHLENGNTDEAIAEFRRASGLGINQEQALAAITQTENEIASAEINSLQRQIGLAETEERWAAVVSDYDAVLTIDPNLVFAIDGRDYAGKRLNLDQLLANAIDIPERFAEDSVFEQTRDIYFTGRSIENPGFRLAEQLDDLQALLETSQVPINIQLVSDNLTNVTLLRIGSLGSFEQHQLSLKPGVYVAVGTRSGYRDVREEFTVGFGLTPASVLVQCDERVVATNGR